VVVISRYFTLVGGDVLEEGHARALLAAGVLQLREPVLGRHGGLHDHLPTLLLYHPLPGGALGPGQDLVRVGRLLPVVGHVSPRSCLQSGQGSGLRLSWNLPLQPPQKELQHFWQLKTSRVFATNVDLALALGEEVLS
jgi:hypothetical protein